MRAPELMISILKEMSEDNMGLLIITKTVGMNVRKQQRYHQVELLVDAGHAQWTSPEHHSARITNAGYDFLDATSNQANGEKAKAKFLDLFNQGVSYARAAQATVEFVAKAVGV